MSDTAPNGLWYFAHPYTERDEFDNYVQAAEEANYGLCCARSAELILRGFNIYSPIAHTHPIHMASPILLQRHEHKLWYLLDNEVIRATKWTGIILAPGWERSSGCNGELALFTGLGLPRAFYEDCINQHRILHGRKGPHD